MGSTFSVKINHPCDFKYFSIRFDESDKLRLITATKEVINLTKKVASSFWVLQNVHETVGFVELKLEGTPFTPSKEIDIKMKLFLCELIKQYYAIGWHIKISSDIKLEDNGSDIVIVEKLEPLSTEVFCLSLNGTNKIKLIGKKSTELVAHIKATIEKYWSSGIDSEKSVDSCFEFRLKGAPWIPFDADGNESHLSVVLINGILSTLFHLGWIFAAAVKSANKINTLNSLYFKYLPEETEECKFFGLSLHGTNLLKLVCASPELVTAAKAVMPKLWPNGILDGDESEAYTFYLNGSPWIADGKEEIDANLLFNNLFSFFNENNWNLYATCTLTMTACDKSTFFFRSNRTPRVTPQDNLCISLFGSDKIRILNKNNNVIDIIRDCIIQSWPQGIQKETCSMNVWEFKLLGTPFVDVKERNIRATFMMLMILSGLENDGYRLISSADLNGKSKIDLLNDDWVSHDLHTWFFVAKKAKEIVFY